MFEDYFVKLVYYGQLSMVVIVINLIIEIINGLPCSRESGESEIYMYLVCNHF
jgi:hypothetical protein